MAKFRKKPVTIEAVRWTGENLDEVFAFCNVSNPKQAILDLWRGEILIMTLEGTMRAATGDWIIKGVKGEYYPCKPDIFEETYEPVEA